MVGAVPRLRFSATIGGKLEVEMALAYGSSQKRVSSSHTIEP
jgi:hypothetical protein